MGGVHRVVTRPVPHLVPEPVPERPAHRHDEAPQGADALRGLVLHRSGRPGSNRRPSAWEASNGQRYARHAPQPCGISAFLRRWAAVVSDSRGHCSWHCGRISLTSLGLAWDSGGSLHDCDCRTPGDRLEPPRWRSQARRRRGNGPGLVRVRPPRLIGRPTDYRSGSSGISGTTWSAASWPMASPWARCEDCGHERLIPFSCKSRGICPSCNARRMCAVAAHLTDHVLRGSGCYRRRARWTRSTYRPPRAGCRRRLRPWRRSRS